MLNKKSQSDTILDGALVTAFGDRLTATGDIAMGAVSTSVDNSYRSSGFQGLGWGTVEQKWNKVETVVTQLSGNNVTLTSGGSITGVGTQIAAAADLANRPTGTSLSRPRRTTITSPKKAFTSASASRARPAVDAVMNGDEPATCFPAWPASTR